MRLAFVSALLMCGSMFSVCIRLYQDILHYLCVRVLCDLVWFKQIFLWSTVYLT